jgi:hypothetical protein
MLGSVSSVYPGSVNVKDILLMSHPPSSPLYKFDNKSTHPHNRILSSTPSLQSLVNYPSFDLTATTKYDCHAAVTFPAEVPLKTWTDITDKLNAHSAAYAPSNAGNEFFHHMWKSSVQNCCFIYFFSTHQRTNIRKCAEASVILCCIKYTLSLSNTSSYSPKKQKKNGLMSYQD